MNSITKTNLEKIPLLHRGKVRDVYDLQDKLLIVSTDRLSAFDYILPTPIPGKGKILTELSCYWFKETQNLIPNHFISTDLSSLDLSVSEKKELSGRSMIVKKANRLPVEAIVRGYITGSAWKDYQREGKVNGIVLPPHLQEGDLLPWPIFTPTTKAAVGEHDVPLVFDQVVEQVGEKWAFRMREIAIQIFKEASKRGSEKGLLLADTKMEFGIFEDQIILIDELLTPDSSRFWLASEYQPGKPLNPWDKQIVRDYLLKSDWDRKSVPPALPEEIVQETLRRYQKILDLFVKRAQG